jgi:hypothetical protein
MNRSEHLTENQLTEYFGDALEREAKHAIGRHLLLCDFCLKRLPQPTPEQFMAALMTENETDEDSPDERKSPATRLESIAQLLKQPKVFALSAAGTMALVLFFTAFFWLGAAKSSEMESEVTKNFEIKDAQSVFNQTGEEIINSPSESSTVESNNPSSAASTRIVAEQNSVASTSNNAPKQNLKTASRNDSNPKTSVKSANSEKANISSTRGGFTVPKCSNNVAVVMMTGLESETVTLKWKKVPKAAKYHLYISDDEEILVDEFETERETAYVLKKPLDPVRTYKWKVVVTLENGNTVIGDSQKFTVKDLKSNQKKSEKKEKSEIRCSEDKLNH